MKSMASSSNPLSVPDMEGDHSPRFGNWDADTNIPYTEYFDKVVKGKTGGKKVNSSHPDENPDTFSEVKAAANRTEPETELPKPKHDSRAGEDGDRSRGFPTCRDTVALKANSVSPRHRAQDSPTRRDTVALKPTSDSPRQQTGDRTTSGEPQRKMYKTNGGAANRSMESSPLHPQYQLKTAGRGGGSSPWERKGSGEGSHGLPNTPGRPKLRTIGHGDDIPEKSSTVPPFGEWDENNPSSAENYSDIFNKVREEKQGGSAKVPIFASDSKYLYGRKQDKKFTSSSCCCFNWGKK